MDSDVTPGLIDGGLALLIIFAASLVLFAALETRVPRGVRPPRRRQRWGANAALTASFILVNGLMPLSLVAAAALAARCDFGLLHLLGVAPAAAFALTILARSLTAYASHRLMHAVPWLWRLHRVHHLDPALDVSGAARFHPLEPVVVYGLALVFVLLLGLDPLAVLAYELAEAALAVFSHANIRLPGWLDRGLGLVLVTPDLHRVHHSPLHSETDSNFGSTLSIWDRLFGTMRRKPGEALAAQSVGLDDCPDARASSLLWLLASPATGKDWRRRDAAAREEG